MNSLYRKDIELIRVYSKDSAWILLQNAKIRIEREPEKFNEERGEQIHNAYLYEELPSKRIQLEGIQTLPIYSEYHTEGSSDVKLSKLLIGYYATSNIFRLLDYDESSPPRRKRKQKKQEPRNFLDDLLFPEPVVSF